MREREYVYVCMCVYALGSMLPSEVLALPELLCGYGARGRAGLLLTPTGMRLEMLRGICGRDVGKVQGPSHLLLPDSEILLGDVSWAPKLPVPQCGDGEGQDTAAQPPCSCHRPPAGPWASPGGMVSPSQSQEVPRGINRKKIAQEALRPGLLP